MLKYQKVARKIIEYIEKNNLPPGTKLMSLEELMEKTGYGKNTIIKGLNLLQNSGIIFQVQGSGIYVRGHNRSNYINLSELKGFQSSMRQNTVTSKTLNCQQIYPNENVKQQLKLSEDDKIYHVHRIRYMDQIQSPFCIENSYYSCNVVPYLDKDITNESIFNYLRDSLNIVPAFCDKFLSIKDLSKNELNLLDIQADEEVGIFIEETYYLPDGTPYNYSEIIYPKSEANFFLQVTNNFQIL